jgi:glutamate racemase
MNDLSIGIFDSGMGGLTVMRALVQRLPNEQFLYLGDTARLPYGTKSAETVSRYAVQAALVLAKRGIKLLVVACNTASSVALPALVAAFAPIPVIGVIEPGARAAVAAAANGPIAVIATEGTVKRGAYMRAIQALCSEVQVVQQACPLFVSLAEEGLVGGSITAAVAEHYLLPLLVAYPKCLVLGCTHFPVLRDAIAAVTGPEIVLVDSAETTAVAVGAELSRRKLLREEHRSEPHQFLVTDAPDRFVRVGGIFLGTDVDPSAVELIDLQ